MKTLSGKASSLPMLRLRLEIIQSPDTDPHCMFGGCVLYLRLGDMDLLCMFRSYDWFV